MRFGNPQESVGGLLHICSNRCCKSLWNHHKRRRWEAPRLLYFSRETRRVAEDQVCRTDGDFPRRNGAEIIGTTNSVLPIAAWTGVSILVERIDSNTQGKPKR